MVALRRLAVSLLLAAAASPALADFKRDYGNGLQALESGDYARAIRELESAIADNPQSKKNLRLYGMRYADYLPHYYLGEARFRAGDCAGALRAWEEAERQGVIAGAPEISALNEGKARCASQAVDVTAIAATARTALGDLSESIDRLTGLKRNRLLAADWRAFKDWDAALSRADQARAEMEGALPPAIEARDAAAIERIIDRAGEQRRELQAVIETVDTRLTSLERQQQSERIAQERNQARVELIQAIAAARSTLGEGVEDAQVQRLGRELTALTVRGDGLDSASSVGDYRDLTRSINGKLREYRQAMQDYRNRQLDIARRTPPPELMDAAEAYFAGRYQDTARLLANPSQFSDPRVQVQAHLFRAAARYNLFVLDGEDDRTLLRQAENDIRSIKRLTGGYSPYLAAFPPKFMSFYEATL